MKSKKEQNDLKFICLSSASGPLIVPYKVERSSRVKRMFLQINGPEVVTLKMPLRHSERCGEQFLREHGEWICQTLAKQPRAPRLSNYLLRNPWLSIGGKTMRLAIHFQARICSYRIDEKGRTVDICIHPRVPAEAQIFSLLKGLAREVLPKRLHYWAKRIEAKPHGVVIRDQKCRWGSCSETGGISLNWRLILLTPKLQDHVMLHELAHLRHFDHSPAFYRWLEKLDRKAAGHGRPLDWEAPQIISLGGMRG